MKLLYILGACLLAISSAEAGYKLNWEPSTPEQRQGYQVFGSNGKLGAAKLSSSVDLRKDMPAVYDQGQLGSCTANAIAGMYEYMEKVGGNEWSPSRLAIYYNERSMEGDVGQDAGAVIADGMKSLQTVGVCHEALWPYDTSKFSDAPSAECQKQQGDFTVPSSSIYTIDDSNREQGVKQALSSGFPVVFGFTVYQSFENDQNFQQTGMMPMPAAGESKLGGHAVLAVGYDDSKQAVLIRNSWGTRFYGSMAGYFWMPYAFIFDANQANDFWVINHQVSSGSSSGPTETPTTDVPTTDAPTTDIPTAKPTHLRPTQTPTHNKPTTQAPTHHKPTQHKPTHHKPTHHKPTHHKPTHKKPHKPTHKKPNHHKKHGCDCDE